MAIIWRQLPRGFVCGPFWPKVGFGQQQKGGARVIAYAWPEHDDADDVDWCL